MDYLDWVRFEHVSLILDPLKGPQRITHDFDSLFAVSNQEY